MTIDYPVNALNNIGFVCIEAKHNGKWVLCLHSRRGTWECPGGHVEKGETALEAAKRELIEETGAKDFDIVPLWDYAALDDTGAVHNNGRVYYAEIRSFNELSETSEMTRIGLFNEIPVNTTYDRDDMIDMLMRAEKAYNEYKEKGNE